MRFNNLELQTEISALTRLFFAVLQKNHASGVVAKAAWPYSPQTLAVPFASSIKIFTQEQTGRVNPCKAKKKAVWSSRVKKATANELLLIGRSSIRETLHSLLTRRCVLKGRTIITNWTCGRGGVCRCRRRGKKNAPKCLCICVPLLVCSFRKGGLVTREMLPAAAFHCEEVWLNRATMFLLVVSAICA